MKQFLNLSLITCSIFALCLSPSIFGKGSKGTGGTGTGGTKGTGGTGTGGTKGTGGTGTGGTKGTGGTGTGGTKGTGGTGTGGTKGTGGTGTGGSSAFHIFLQLSSTAWAGNGGNFYNPYDPQTYDMPVPFFVFYTPESSSNTRNYFLTFNYGQNPLVQTRRLKNGTEYLEYQIYKFPNQNSTLRPYAEATLSSIVSREVLPNMLPPIQETIFWSIPASQNVTAGTYTDSIGIKGFTGEFSLSHQFDTGPSPLPLTALVPAILNLAIVNPGAPFVESSTSKTLNFPTMQGESSVESDLVVVSNTSYQLRIKSTNGFQLANNITPLDQFSYTTALNGVPQTFSGTGFHVIDIYSGKTSVLGERYPLKFTTTAPPMTISGNYSDTIMAEIQAW